MTSMKDIMIDIETMGKGSNAAILSIGAVIFDTDKGSLGDSFYVNVDIASCLYYKLQIDQDTKEWWDKQSQEAKDALKDPTPIPLPDALIMLNDFMKNGIYRVWGNGVAFDNVILRNAFKAVNLKCPWDYWNDMCFRTLKKLFHVKTDIQIEGVKHNALYDAKYQALVLIEIFKSNKIKESKG